MFTSKIKICDAFGIPVFVDISFLILLFLFTTSFGSFPFGMACAMSLALSVVFHELGHSLTARIFGYRTRDITLSLLGGCASLIGMPRKAWQEFATSFAGPLVSFALSAVAWALLAFVPMPNEFTAGVLLYAMYMNFTLGVFNLLPGFPMDGGRIFRSIARIFTTRTKATYIAMIVGRGVAVLLALRGVHAMLTGGSFGFISSLIAWMIWQDGLREYRQTVEEERFNGPWSYSARVSPPPYGGDDEDIEIRRK